MITCIDCKIAQPDENFSPRTERYRTGKRRTRCHKCHAAKQRINYEKYKTESYFKYKANAAKRGASTRAKGIPCDLDAEYLESIWTDYCPVLGVKLKQLTDRTDDCAAELDRFDPAKGYVKGNVFFLSRRANRLKNDATLEELEAIVKWMKSIVTES